MSWWHKRRAERATQFDERLIAALPESTRSVVVQLGADNAYGPRYWQLKTKAGVKDVALNMVALGDRDSLLPVIAEEAARFIEQSVACDLTPMYLFTVAKTALLPTTLKYVAHGVTPLAGPLLYLMVPASAVYDFTASIDDLPVAAFVDGWPMKDAMTLSAFVLQGAPLKATGVKTAPIAVHVDRWSAADPRVVALFDQPLAAVAQKDISGMFVFTDVS